MGWGSKRKEYKAFVRKQAKAGYSNKPDGGWYSASDSTQRSSAKNLADSRAGFKL